MQPRRRLVWIVVLGAALWHAGAVALAWSEASSERHGRDFASYYYAFEVAAQGGDPYSKSALDRAARADGTRRAVHPFFYPPPFLLAVAWTRAGSLVTAYRIWFWLDEIAALTVAMLLGWGWRGVHRAWPAYVAVAVGTLSAIADNHLMGQMNLPVLALVLGAALVERRRPTWAGVLVGVACMLKMSPAVFVLWWLARRELVPAIAACLTAVALSVAALAAVPAAVQLRFYTDVLPSFGSGEYNGLRVPIDLFGNHSIPNLIAAVWPTRGPGLSPTAHAVSTATNLALVAVALLAFRRPPPDELARLGQLAALAVVMLLVPVYTYEHHVIWAIPAAVVTLVGSWQGRLPAWARVAAAAAFVVWVFPIATLKGAAHAADAPVLALVLRESKFAALVVWGIGAAAVGLTPIRDNTR